MDGLTGLGPAVEPPLDVWQSALASALSSTTAPAGLAALVPPTEEVEAGWQQPPDDAAADADGPEEPEGLEGLSWDDPVGTDLSAHHWLGEAGADEDWT